MNSASAKVAMPAPDHEVESLEGSIFSPQHKYAMKVRKMMGVAAKPDPDSELISLADF
jgi:hypothetical protein